MKVFLRACLKSSDSGQSASYLLILYLAAWSRGCDHWETAGGDGRRRARFTTSEPARACADCPPPCVRASPQQRRRCILERREVLDVFFVEGLEVVHDLLLQLVLLNGRRC